MKGITEIELIDVHTGKVEKYKETNLVTNAMADFFSHNINGMLFTIEGNTNDLNGNMLPLCKNAIGGILLFSDTIKQCTQTNGIVLDGFLGSATTLIACEQIDRTCYGIELEPKFVDVAVVRYLQYKNNDSSDVYVIRDGQRIEYNDVPKPERMDDNS